MSAPNATLKCVITWSNRRNLCSIVEDALRARIADDDVMVFGEDTVITYAPNEPTQIRDWVRSALEDGESLLVLEFERWSGYGPGIDSRWLMRRGH